MSDRFRAIASVWNWLPAFRAVAETEHLPSAAKMIGVTAPALSRTVRQLEDALEADLFSREGRGLKLNDDGLRLLSATRNAMRLLDDATSTIEHGGLAGPIRWTSTWVFEGFMIDAITTMTAQHPEVRPTMRPRTDFVAAELLRGELDFAVLTKPEPDHDGVTCTHVGSLAQAVYCHASHPAASHPQTIDELRALPFAAPAPGQYVDGWPPEQSRNVQLECAELSAAYRAVRDHGFIAAMPRATAAEYGGLVEILEVAPLHAYAMHRDVLDPDGVVPRLTRHLRDVLNSAA